MTSLLLIRKGLFAGKVQVGDKTYYPPLLPCVTDFASVPSFSWGTLNGPAVGLLTPSFLSQIQGCDHRVYEFGAGGPAVPANYQGLMWKAPAGSEAGWGLNLAHQGDSMFATWFTYDADGRGTGTPGGGRLAVRRCDRRSIPIPKFHL